MPKATKEDAMLLLEFEKLKFSDRIEDAFAWFYRDLGDAPTLSAEEFDRKYPKGSDGRRNAAIIAAFHETMGTVAKHGLVNLDFLFDRYAVFPFWEKLSGRMAGDRTEHPEMGMMLGENFEWLAVQNKAWAERRKAWAERNKGKASK